MMRLEAEAWLPASAAKATDFVILVMNPRGAKAILKSKVKIGADCRRRRRPKGRDAAASSDVTSGQRCSPTRAPAVSSLESPWRARRCARQRRNEKLYKAKVTAEQIRAQGLCAVLPLAKK